MRFGALGSWIWIRFHHCLRKRHYYLAFGLFALGLMVVLTNLDFVFDLFNRNTTLTGRVGLWEHILDIVSQKPCWLGHGFGAVWMLDAFREDVRLGIGWASQPLIGDNGFIDILLHLGIVGLMMFAGLLVTAFIRAIKYAVSHKTLADFSHYCF